MMKAFANGILIVFALAMFAGVGAVAYSMADMGILTDQRQHIAATTVCVGTGVSISIFKQEDQSNGPCDDRELSRIMLLSGLPDQARYNECSMPDALRKFAKVSNCLNFEEVGYEQVLMDVQVKSLACGGKPRKIKFWKQRKYRECMEAIA